MNEIFEILQRMEAQLAALEADNAKLRKENDELRQRLGATKPEPEPLKEYDSIEEIVWERGQHTADTYAMQQRFGNKHDFRPFKQVIVRGLGQVYRTAPGQQMPDWYAIAHLRVQDVTAKDNWVCLVQEGDDAWESDRDDMEALVRNYKGGLRYNLSNWLNHSVGAELLPIFIESHPGVTGPEDASRTIPVTPAG